MKEALLRFTVVLFSGKHIFNGVQGHSSIKMYVFHVNVNVIKKPSF